MGLVLPSTWGSCDNNQHQTSCPWEALHTDLLKAMLSALQWPHVLCGNKYVMPDASNTIICEDWCMRLGTKCRNSRKSDLSHGKHSSPMTSSKQYPAPFSDHTSRAEAHHVMPDAKKPVPTARHSTRKGSTPDRRCTESALCTPHTHSTNPNLFNDHAFCVGTKYRT